MATSSALSAPILRTKLHRPVVGEGFVHRGRLNERLDVGEQGMLTVVSAPAGYGKSTQVSDWAGSLDSPCAWVSLDEQDSDPAQFLAGNGQAEGHGGRSLENEQRSIATSSGAPGTVPGLAWVLESPQFPRNSPLSGDGPGGACT